jgi:O-antigen/teichoic acid export membrane protein
MLIQPIVLLLLLGATHSISTHPFTAKAAMSLNLAAMGLAFLVGAAILRSFLPKAVEAADPVLRGFSWATSVLPLIFMASAGALFGQIDTLIVGAIKGAKAVGIYGVADRGAESAAFLFIAAGTVFAPTVSRMYAAGEMEKLQRMVTKFARVTLLLSLPVALALIFDGEWFLRMFYGPEFVEGRAALAILTLGQILPVAIGPVGVLLIMTAHESKAAVALGWGVLANIILSFAMVPRWGLQGAAIANTISIAFVNILLVRALWKALGIQSWAIGRVKASGA